MNLISGKIYDASSTNGHLEKINELILKTLNGKKLTSEMVIAACGKLSYALNEKEHLPYLLALGMTKDKAKRELLAAKQMLSEEYLLLRLKIELGDMKPIEFVPYSGDQKVRHEIKPLGVLFHIAAGNMDVLPVFSVIEGLVTGNINILKLPGADSGLSVMILSMLIEYEPLIADYVMVFDSPSADLSAMKKMAEASDAIVVWGGDAAVSSVRNMAAPDTRIIEWGHKISFAYVSGSDVSDIELEGIAYNICNTNQLFCSSCQGIYLDTDDFSEVCLFAKRFIKILDKVAKTMPEDNGVFINAQKTLEIYTEELEADSNKRIYKTDGISVMAESDSVLTPSYMYRNLWVKPLPKNKIIPELKKYKNHLQTAALICGENNRRELEDILLKTGVVRITNGKNMSETYCGQPHDGEFALRRYTKIVSYEY